LVVKGIEAYVEARLCLRGLSRKNGHWRKKKTGRETKGPDAITHAPPFKYVMKYLALPQGNGGSSSEFPSRPSVRLDGASNL
jgi:hypothetical protein